MLHAVIEIKLFMTFTFQLQKSTVLGKPCMENVCSTRFPQEISHGERAGSAPARTFSMTLPQTHRAT